MTAFGRNQTVSFRVIVPEKLLFLQRWLQ